MEATLSSLPPELLSQILEATTEDEHLSPSHLKASYRDLVSFALVARAWTATAQQFLWRRVCLTRSHKAELWLASPLQGRYRTFELHIMRGNTLDEVDAMTLAAGLHLVLEQANGVEVLRLDRCVLALTTLALPTLIGLKHLHIFALVLVNRLDAAPAVLPFALSSFTIEGTRETLSPALLRSLFLSSTHSLTTLNLAGPVLVNAAPLISSFHLIAPTLTSLSLTTPWLSLTPHLASCTSLTHLSLLSALSTSPFAPHAEAILRILPSSLHTLRLKEPRPREAYQVLRTLLAHLDSSPALSALKELRLVGGADQARASLQVEQGGMTVLERRGVKLIYGKEPTSISSLPPELLLRILELTTEDELRARYYVHFSHRRLASFSLVARAWKAPAQTLLWRNIVLRERSGVEQWLECPVLGEHRTVQFTIERDIFEGLREMQQVMRETAAGTAPTGDAVDFTGVLDEALRAVRGVEVLQLEGCALGPTSLALPNLADLKHLRLHARRPIVSSDDTDEQPAILPFQLSSLYLVSWASSLYTSFFHTLFVSSANSLTTLYLDGLAPISLSTFLPHFHLVAPSLTSLALTSPWAPLIPHLHLCTSLTHLSLLQSTSMDTHARAIFRILPNSLRTISLEQQTLHEKVEILRVLVEHLEWPALRGLWELVLGRDGHEALASLEREH